MNNLVLDASALLAILQQEPGSRRWADAVAGSTISAVNISEVIGKLIDIAMPLDEILAALEAFDLTVAEFDFDQAVATAQLRHQTKHAGLSLADRACIALAQKTGFPILTADRAWKQLRLGVTINVVR